MTSSAFILTLSLDTLDQSSLDGLAEQILEACQDSGLPATTCKPWQHPALAPVDPLSPLQQTGKLF